MKIVKLFLFILKITLIKLAKYIVISVNKIEKNRIANNKYKKIKKSNNKKVKIVTIKKLKLA